MSNPNCPQCPGQGVLLGTLGRTSHYRCRDCGWEFSKTRRARTPKTRCYLRMGSDALEEATPCTSIKKAVGEFAATATELDRYGQSIEATIHIAKNRDELDEYPDYTLALGPRGGIVKARA